MLFYFMSLAFCLLRQKKKESIILYVIILLFILITKITYSYVHKIENREAGIIFKIDGFSMLLDFDKAYYGYVEKVRNS